MKRVTWIGDSRQAVKGFAPVARQRVPRAGERKLDEMTERLKIEHGSGNVFRDIGFPPEEAQNLQLRSELMTRVERFVKRAGVTQTEAARALGIAQPRLNDLLRGKIDKFSLDALVNMLGHAGMRVELRVKKAA